MRWLGLAAILVACGPSRPAPEGGSISNAAPDAAPRALEPRDESVSTYRCFQGEWHQVKSICPP